MRKLAVPIAIQAVLFGFLILAAVLAAGAHGSVARPVALSDATVPPTYLVYLTPRAHVTYARSDRGHAGENCPRGGYFTDVSAYHWDGSALGSQRWLSRLDQYVWANQNGRVVAFNGVTFTNRTRAPVLVAGWCDR